MATRFRKLLDVAPHATSRLVGLAVCGLAGSALQHTAAGKGVDSYVGIVVWALILMLAAGSLAVGIRAALPSRIPSLFTDALAAWIVVTYALVDATHTRVDSESFG